MLGIKKRCFDCGSKLYTDKYKYCGSCYSTKYVRKHCTSCGKILFGHSTKCPDCTSQCDICDCVLATGITLCKDCSDKKVVKCVTCKKFVYIYKTHYDGTCQKCHHKFDELALSVKYFKERGVDLGIDDSKLLVPQPRQGKFSGYFEAPSYYSSDVICHYYATDMDFDIYKAEHLEIHGDFWYRTIYYHIPKGFLPDDVDPSTLRVFSKEYSYGAKHPLYVPH